jgi:hypothetical protein
MFVMSCSIGEIHSSGDVSERGLTIITAIHEAAPPEAAFLFSIFPAHEGMSK